MDSTSTADRAEDSMSADAPCPVYACTLSPAEHESVDPEGWADFEPESLWHADGRGGHWPSPLKPSPPIWNPRDSRIYGPYEERVQLESRSLGMSWSRGYWLRALVDVDFEQTMMGVGAITFSGDLRPIDSRASLSLWSLVASEQKVDS